MAQLSQPHLQRKRPCYFLLWASVSPPSTGFLNLSTFDIWNWIILMVGCPVHQRLFSSILSLCPLDAHSNTLPSRCDNKKYFQACWMSPGNKISPSLFYCHRKWVVTELQSVWARSRELSNHLCSHPFHRWRSEASEMWGLALGSTDILGTSSGTQLALGTDNSGYLF